MLEVVQKVKQSNTNNVNLYVYEVLCKKNTRNEHSEDHHFIDEVFRKKNHILNGVLCKMYLWYNS